MDSRDIINLQEAYLEIYAPQELTEEEQIAAEYFYEQGLNEDGVAIVIEELGIDEFNEWVEDILEDYDLMERKLSAGETTLPARSRRRIVGGEIGAPRSFSNPESAKTAGGRRRAARAAARETTQSQTARQKDLATRLAAQKERNDAKEKAKSTQAPTPRSETPSQTKKGIGGAIGGVLKWARKKAETDIEQTKKSLGALGQSWERASNTKAAQRARIAAKKGARAVERHGAAVGGAAGRAVGTAVGATLRAGQQAGRSETGQRLKKSLGKVVFKDEVKEWVETLIDEGYDLSDYTWEDMYEIYEAAVADVPVRAKPQSSHNAMLSELIRVHGPKVGMQKFKEMIKKENYESILAYLVNEGYAETIDSAERIMESMSEEWQDQILNEMPFQIYTYKNGQRVNVGKPYNFDPNNPESKKKARSRVRKRINNLDQDAGGYTHGYHETP